MIAYSNVKKIVFAYALTTKITKTGASHPDTNTDKSM